MQRKGRNAGLSLLKSGMSLEGREEVRKRLQLQQVQWISEAEPHRDGS